MKSYVVLFAMAMFFLTACGGGSSTQPVTDSTELDTITVSADTVGQVVGDGPAGSGTSNKAEETATPAAVK